jgi:hypothetical protein
MRTNALTKNLQLFCSLRLRPSPKSPPQLRLKKHAAASKKNPVRSSDVLPWKQGSQHLHPRLAPSLPSPPLASTLPVAAPATMAALSLSSSSMAICTTPSLWTTASCRWQQHRRPLAETTSSARSNAVLRRKQRRRTVGATWPSSGSSSARRRDQCGLPMGAAAPVYWSRGVGSWEQSDRRQLGATRPTDGSRRARSLEQRGLPMGAAAPVYGITCARRWEQHWPRFGHDGGETVSVWPG